MPRLSENYAIVPIVKPADIEAGSTGDSINMGLLYRVAFLISFGAITGDGVLTCKSGATAGTQTTSETFRYRLADAVQAAAGADQYANWATASTLTLTAATYVSKLLIVEIDAAAMTDGQPWLTLAVSNAASVLFASVVAVGDPRYMANDVLTAI